LVNIGTASREGSIQAVFSEEETRKEREEKGKVKDEKNFWKEEAKLLR